MKKYLFILAAAGITLPAGAQSIIGATDAFQVSQQDMKGTARFMSMAGAFGALGGDLSVLSQNPGGIGIYRNSDIGFTLDLDCQHSNAKSLNASVNQDKTHFYLNNIGYVGSFRLPSKVMPNINFGFTFNKSVSFNRSYRGVVPKLDTSLSNYIAGINNSEDITAADLTTTDSYDPYNPTDGGYISPWISILGYDARLVTPEGSDDYPHWVGQYGQGTSGSGYFSVEEKGSVDEYNISFGGNIANVLFWGMDFGIIDMNYTSRTIWGEMLDNAYIPDNNDNLIRGKADWSLYNYHNLNATGFNYKLGFILRPIQQLRLGFAFHTPTWYSLDQTFYGDIAYNYPGSGIRPESATAMTNDGYDGYNTCNFRTPWKIIASAAGVIGSNFILSFDYEWTGYNGMHYSDGNRYDDWDWNWYTAAYNSDPYLNTNNSIKAYYKAMNTVRIGAEYRPIKQFSIRAGYAHSSSPVTKEARDSQEVIYTSGTRPQFTFDNSTDYITCGLGFRSGGFYMDAAYVYKHRSSEYHAFAQDPGSPIQSPKAKISTDNSQVVLTMGFKF